MFEPKLQPIKDFYIETIIKDQQAQSLVDTGNQKNLIIHNRKRLNLQKRDEK